MASSPPNDDVTPLGHVVAMTTTAADGASVAHPSPFDCLRDASSLVHQINNNEVDIGPKKHDFVGETNGSLGDNDESNSKVLCNGVSEVISSISSSSSPSSSSRNDAASAAATTVATATVLRPSRPQSSAYVLSEGYWARFGWLPPENIVYLQEAMALEEVTPVPLDLQEHWRSWLEEGDGGDEDGGDEVTDPAHMEAMLRDYLQEEGLLQWEEELGGGSAWRLGASPLGGRFGVFARRALVPGEAVLRDAPLVLGPRAGAAVPPVCAVCHGARRPLRACPQGCGLPVCAEERLQCHAQPRHQRECRVLVSWRPTRSRADVASFAPTGGWSPALLRALCAVRALGLPPRRRRLLRALTAHDDSQHAFEVDLIRRAVDEAPRACDAAVMALACRAFDANAFETAPAPGSATAPDAAPDAQGVGSPTGRCLDGAGATLRALFPLAAMLNHACTPNTRHGYDADGFLRLYAATSIAEGDELTNSYTPLLWATPARRHLLRFTKHFDCACKRCADPQEGGATLSALRCARLRCPGVLLPQQPLEPASPWVCGECGARVRAKEAQAVQAVLGGPLAAIDATDPLAALAALRRLAKPLPPTNHVLLEIKACLVWLLGHKRGFTWQELPDELLRLKESLVRELLRLVELLQAGQCRMQGLLKYELHCTLETRISRLSKNQGAIDCQGVNESNENVLCNGVDDTAVHTKGSSHLNDAENSVTSSSETGSILAENGDRLGVRGSQKKDSKDLAFGSGEVLENGGGGGEMDPPSDARARVGVLASMLAVESADALAEAAVIFADDVTAPLDLQQRVASARLVRGCGGGV